MVEVREREMAANFDLRKTSFGHLNYLTSIPSLCRSPFNCDGL
jgi:hypothetical protein